MAIVPLSPGILQYAKPVWPIPYFTSCYPILHPYAYWYPDIYSKQITDLAVPSQTAPYVWSEEDNLYRLINATYNPGNYWIWPPGR